MVLVTRDLDFPLPNEPTGSPALVLIRVPFNCGASTLVWLLRDFLNTTPAEEIWGRITTISPGRMRSRRLPWAEL